MASWKVINHRRKNGCFNKLTKSEFDVAKVSAIWMQDKLTAYISNTIMIGFVKQTIF